MDPDGLTVSFFVISGLILLGSTYFLGLFTASDTEKDARTVLGFSNATAGLAVLCCICCGFFVYFGKALFADVNVWLFVPTGIVCFIICMLCFSLGLCNGDETARAQTIFVPFVFIARYILGPAVTAPVRLIFHLAKLDAASGVTEEDVLSLVDTVEEQDIIDESQKEMITNIFELDDVTACDIMTHRTEVIGIDETAPLREVVAVSREQGFSRMPVYHKSLDNVTGIIYVKDLLGLFSDPQKAEEPVKNYIRSAMFVPEACRARELLIDFKLKHTQIAIVVDEYGGTSGVVTMEDILEEIVGNIQDEFDNEEELLLPCEDGYLCDGSLDLEDVFDAFELDMPQEDDPDFDSVGGLITERLGRIPAVGENIEIVYGGLRFTVIEVGERRILKVRCTLQPNETEQSPTVSEE
ncbi:MAG: hemolysin family protein [Oscillospiraceae bacterium]|nr:hemolysin family protein [Oscillospiraceae bacterium]